MRCKKLLSLLLALVLALGCVGTAFAVEVTEVSEFPDMDSAVSSGKSDIKLMDSFECGMDLALSGNLNLYLNGKTLSMSNQSINCVGAYTLNIYGGANADDTTLSGTLENARVTLNNEGAKLNIYSGTVDKIWVVSGSASISGGHVTIHQANQPSDISITDGYITLNISDGASKISSDISITGGYFNRDVSNNVPEGYECVANTDSATSTAYPFKVQVKSPDNFLDLDETDATYPIKKDIDQNYTLDVSESYTDKTKVKLTWTITDIAASYTSDKTWDPDTLSWTDGTGSGTTVDTNGAATFTLTNLSSVQVNATASFTAESGFNPTVAYTETSGTANDGTVTLDTVVGDNHAVADNPTAPSETITATVTPGDNDFKSLPAATDAKYGTYTITLTSILSATAAENEGTFTATATNAWGTVSYQWQKWNESAEIYEDIIDATNAAYTGAEDGVTYRCVVTDSTTSVATNLIKIGA